MAIWDNLFRGVADQMPEPNKTYNTGGAAGTAGTTAQSALSLVDILAAQQLAAQQNSSIQSQYNALQRGQQYPSNSIYQNQLQNQLMGQAVYKTQAQQYADAQNVSMRGAVSYITSPSPTSILNGSGGAVLTFSDGSVYYIQSGLVGYVGSGPGQEQAPEIEDGTVLHIPGRSGFNSSVSEIRLAIRSPNKERAAAEIDAGGVVLEVSRENISAIVSALLEAGSVRRESE